MENTQKVKRGKKKKCVYGSCRSDSRYPATFNNNKEIWFIPFPKPIRQKEKCLLWIQRCGRLDNFDIKSIRPDSFVCSLHFQGGNGPTKDFPDILDCRETEEYRIWKEHYAKYDKLCMPVTSENADEVTANETESVAIEPTVVHDFIEDEKIVSGIMVFCVVPNCSQYSVNKKGKGVNNDSNPEMKRDSVGFFCIPKNDVLKKKWIDAIFSGKAESQECNKIFENRGARVCSNHFVPSDYSISCSDRRRLLPHAIPRVNNALPTLKKRFKLNHDSSTPNSSTNNMMFPTDNVLIRKKLFEPLKKDLETEISFGGQPEESSLFIKDTPLTVFSTSKDMASQVLISRKECSTQTLTLTENSGTQMTVASKDASTQVSPIIRRRKNHAKELRDQMYQMYLERF